MGTREPAQQDTTAEGDTELSPSGESSRSDGFLREIAHIDEIALPNADLVGTTLGHFRIVGLLGQGGMGVVYLAQDERLHREVALKVLPADFANDDERRRRFLREARAVAAVSHPNSR